MVCAVVRMVRVMCGVCVRACVCVMCGVYAWRASCAWCVLCGAYGACVVWSVRVRGVLCGACGTRCV